MTTIVFVGKEVSENYRRCSLRFRHFLRFAAVNTKMLCDDELIIETVDPNKLITFEGFHKSGLNGMVKLMRLMNDNWSYAPGDEQVAWISGNRFFLRMCEQTTNVKEKFDYPL